MPFVWTSITNEAFVTLEQALVSAPVLELPDFTKPLMIEPDACEYCIGAVGSSARSEVAHNLAIEMSY